ncbi:hypothetical protein LPU83_pLPU83c_0432 (plasmid) [Rhizobium favelukesii]|uniref:Uncharacterized protein n=1 Tax=Rhizobium favelukesii TaxID=348824 RepID=W6RJI1_9HYPH|nr:hypothetical protein LPU83_pLPU83c_0432 [Rhizobium favelukesii]
MQIATRRYLPGSQTNKKEVAYVIVGRLIQQ